MRQAARLPLRSGLLVWLAAAAAADASPRVPEAVAARAAAGEPVRVIVELAVPTVLDARLPAAARLQQRGRIGVAQDALSRELAGARYRMTRRYRTLPFAALEVDAAGLAALARSPLVASVAEDRLHAPTLDVSGPLVEADAAHALGFDGSGQTLVVLDTGVDAAHPHLSGQLVDEACFADGTSPFPPGQGDCPNGDPTMFGPGAGSYCTYADLCFHGTHVAAIAASVHSFYSGIAPGAGLISIQIFSEFSGAACGSLPSPCPLALISDQIAALEYVYDTLRLVHAIPAVNLSLGGDTYTTQAACDAANGATKAAIDNLHAVGIATVIAAGNDGYPNAISEPACISSAVSVGATDNLDQVATFTNAASFLSLWAPGKSIKAALYQTTSQANASGTSQAAPHVSGAFAVLRQADPSASPDELLTLLQDTGVPIPHANASTSRIRVMTALDALLPDCDDGQDNDADGVLDLADPGCAGALDDSERGSLQCDDGQDNDGDLQSDFPADPHCWGPSDDREAPSQCGLGAELAPLLGLLGLLRGRGARRAGHA